MRIVNALAMTLMLLAGMGICYGQVQVPKVAIYPWTFAENERGTNSTAVSTAQDVLRKLFEQRGGYEVVSEAVCRRGWIELGFPEVPLTVEELGQLPTTFDPKRLLEFGRKLGVDYVCSGTLGWRVRSVWVALGPKTKADATVSLIIIDVNKGEVVHEVNQLSSASTKAEKWYESAGALLVTWGITLFGGGPKTPHMQNAAVKAIGTATDSFFATTTRKKIE